MKKKDLQELRKKPLSELQRILADEREKLDNFRFNLYMGKVRNIKEVKVRKKNIAQIKTIIREKKNA